MTGCRKSATARADIFASFFQKRRPFFLTTRAHAARLPPMDQIAGASSPHLDEGEQGQAATHSAPRALVLHEIIRAEGEEALKRKPSALAWSALAAGLSMGFSFLTQALLHASLPDAPWRHAVDSFGYSMGFLIVILGRQQLFTESTLTAVLPVLTRRDRKTLLACLRMWGIALAANILGAWLFAASLTVPGVFRADVTDSMRLLAAGTLHAPFAATFLRAVFAGWLIAMMVWLLPSARSARLLTVLLITYVVSLGHLSHIIAGSVEAAYAVLTGSATVATFVFGFMLPTLLGNTIGGVALVALLNHAAIAPEIQAPLSEENG
jgi:formate/nitrite transporter FocA (FNT family)